MKKKGGGFNIMALSNRNFLLNKSLFFQKSILYYFALKVFNKSNILNKRKRPLKLNKIISKSFQVKRKNT